MIKSEIVPVQLEKADWEFLIGYGRPGHIVYGLDEKRIEYFRYGNDDGFQPLVYPRAFGKKKRSFVEVSEEFRLLYNLYPAPDGSKFSKLHDNGMEEDVVLIRPESVRVKLHLLRQFLAVKDMHLAIFFQADRVGNRTLTEAELTKIAKEVKTENLRYDVWAWNKMFALDEEHLRVREFWVKKLFLRLRKRNAEFSRLMIGTLNMLILSFALTTMASQSPIPVITINWPIILAETQKPRTS